MEIPDINCNSSYYDEANFIEKEKLIKKKNERKKKEYYIMLYN